MNVVVLRGRLSKPAEEKMLASGTRLVTLELTVSRPRERADSVPVAWMGAPASAARLDRGAEVLVVGRVRRRFFRTGPGVQSRTEVLADQVVATRQAKRAHKAVEWAMEALRAS